MATIRTARKNSSSEDQENAWNVLLTVFTEIEKPKVQNRKLSPGLYHVHAENILRSITVQFNNSFQEMNCVPTVDSLLWRKSRRKSIEKLSCFIIEPCEGLFSTVNMFLLSWCENISFNTSVTLEKACRLRHEIFFYTSQGEIGLVAITVGLEHRTNFLIWLLNQFLCVHLNGNVSIMNTRPRWTGTLHWL